MEDKNIMINGTKHNFFQFYNINQPLTELKYLNSERLTFTKPVAFKLQNNIGFKRVFVAIVGPKARDVADFEHLVYDAAELLDYDSQFDSGEFTSVYDFSKLKDEDYHIIASTTVKEILAPEADVKVFLYNMINGIYQDEPSQRELVLSKFSYFDATAILQQKPTLLNKLAPEDYVVLLKKDWVMTNLSKKYIATFDAPKPLVFPSEEVFSFGVCRNTLDTNGISYQISLCLYDRESPKDDEIRWAAKYEELATVCREHLKVLDKKLKNQADTIKGLSWKENDIGNADGPKLYPKIMFNQKKEEFITVFLDENEEVVDDPTTILDRRCKIRVALRFESIYVGSKFALQVRVNDVAVSKWIEAYKPKAMIVRKKTTTPKNDSPISSSSKGVKSTVAESEESDINSSSESEEEEDSKPVKRTVKTVKIK